VLTPTLFKSLTNRQQADLLLHYGEFVHTMEEMEFIVDLYLLQDFYVELYFHKTEDNCIILRSYYSKDNYKPEETAQNYYVSHYLGSRHLNA
jgi:hypothetical protein